MAELARKQLESPMENAEQTTIAVLQRDVAHIDRGLIELKEETQRRFNGVESRFDGVDRRFMWLLGAYGAGCVLLLSAYGVGFVKLLDRQDAMRQELTATMDKRFDAVDRKFEAVEAKFDRQNVTLEQLRKLLSAARSTTE